MKNLSMAGFVVLIFSSQLCAADSSTATKEEVDAAKNAVDLRTYQSLQDLLVLQKEAETKKAIAEAERAEALAKLPPTDTKALAGSINTEKFGAAGLVKAIDLLQELAAHVCKETEGLGPIAIYDPTTTQGVVAARLVQSEITRTTDDLKKQRERIDKAIGAQAKVLEAPLLAVAGVTAGIKSIADLASLFKSNITAVGSSFGDGTKSFFSTAIAQKCPSGKVTGLGTGYLGELDTANYSSLRNMMNDLLVAKDDFAQSVAAAKKAADAEKEPKKTELNALVTAANALSKQVDGFIDSLKPNDITDKSPLYNAARYLTYAKRTEGSNILDFDLRLEGLAITKDNIFTGQKLRLSGIAFLAYRLYASDGTLLKGEVLRRMSPPVEVDLAGKGTESDFWTGPTKKPDEKVTTTEKRQ
jgi:hypothetical protein